MAIRLSGLNSGMDTESIVAELVKAKSDKKIKLEGEQKKLSWKQDAWKELNSKIYAFYSKKLSNMRLTSDFNKKTTTASHSAVSVVTGGDAPNVVQTMSITKMAKAGYLTGATISEASGKEGTFTKDTKLVDDLGIADGSSFTITANGTSKEITITESTTINNVLTAMREAGVNANFDEINQRFYISSKNTGEANDFTITANDRAGLVAMSQLGIASSLASDVNTEALYKKYADALTDDSKLQALVAEEVKKRIADYAKQIENSQALIEELQGKLTEAEQEFQSKFVAGGVPSGETNAEGNPIAETDVAKIEEAIANLNWTEKTEEEIAALSAEDKAKYEANKATYEAYNEQLSAAKNLASINGDIAAQNELIAEAEQYIVLGTEGAENTATEALNQLVESEIRVQAQQYKDMLDAYHDPAIKTGAIRIAGQDAEIVLNGATYYAERNTFEINDLTISINSYTTEEITLTTAEDTSGIYDMIKDFFKEYNELINEMDKLYNADSASKYSMLTDEEREALSEDDAKEWDDKIKSALLRRDSSLGTVFEALKTTMLSGVTLSDGTKMYLSSFGINTGGYFDSEANKRNAYHIDGDEDDTTVADKANLLQAAIASDPAQVAEFFSKLARNLYEKLDDLMASTDYSSAFTVYNDKALKKEYDSYKDKIADQEEKIADFEDRYYDKFAKMEVALSKISSQQNSLASLFG